MSRMAMVGACVWGVVVAVLVGCAGCARTADALADADGPSEPEARMAMENAVNSRQSEEIAYSQPGIFMRSIQHAGVTLPFVVYVPPELFATASERSGQVAAIRARLPLIVFLHGSGESGTDGLKPVAQGLLRAVAFDRKRWPAIVVAPQKATSDVRWKDLDAQVLALADELMRDLPIDADRVYLTGLSQGGYGAWEIGARHAQRWAAVVPICGWADDPARVASDLVGARMPLWAFHGEADNVVPAERTREIITAHQVAHGGVASYGSPARASFYPGVGHNSWDKAYGDAALATWLFAQSRADGRNAEVLRPGGVPDASPPKVDR